jgi:peroxiredoxin
MNSIWSLSALFLIFSFCSLSGQPVRISGSGKGYAGTEMKIFTLSDPITKSHKPLSRVTCDDKGFFTVNVPVKGTGTIFIKSGIFTFYLYASEGREYVVKLADFIPKPPEEEQNPFFEEVKLLPEIVNDTNDINNLIRKFDAVYDPAFNRISDRVAYNTKRGDIPEIIEKLNFLSTPGMPEFFSDFIKFRMIMINMVGSGEYSGRVEDSVLINRKFVPGNPAYPDLIEQRFSGYFTSVLNGPSRNDFINSVASSSFAGLEKVILNDGKVSNKELADYIILLNLFPAWYDGSIPKENILKLFSSLNGGDCSEYIKDLAAVISDRMLSLYEGYPAPDFALVDQGGNVKKLAGFEGKYLLLSFARSDNAAVMAEFGILNTWYKKYSANLQVVTILTDNDFASAAARMKSAGFEWIMLNGSKQDMVEYNYNVKMYPAFIIVGRDGKTVSPGCPFPSENLERILSVKFMTK